MGLCASWMERGSALHSALAYLDGELHIAAHQWVFELLLASFVVHTALYAQKHIWTVIFIATLQRD